MRCATRTGSRFQLRRLERFDIEGRAVLAAVDPDEREPEPGSDHEVLGADLGGAGDVGYAPGGIGQPMAAIVDVGAFRGWKSWDDAMTYNWGIASFRWFQGMVVGALTANYLGEPATKIIGTSPGATAFIVGLAGMAICQAIVEAAKRYRPAGVGGKTDAP